MNAIRDTCMVDLEAIINGFRKDDPPDIIPQHMGRLLRGDKNPKTFNTLINAYHSYAYRHYPNTSPQALLKHVASTVALWALHADEHSDITQYESTHTYGLYMTQVASMLRKSGPELYKFITEE